MQQWYKYHQMFKDGRCVLYCFLSLSLYAEMRCYGCMDEYIPSPASLSIYLVGEPIRRLDISCTGWPTSFRPGCLHWIQ